MKRKTKKRSSSTTRRSARRESGALALGPEDRLFVLTGAGVSAESGLPTFRGAGGLWQGHRVEDVASPEAWARDPALVWNFYSMRRQAGLSVKPNPAHLALAEAERLLSGHFFLCTQNVDELHERAGSRRLVHMHGELFKSRCSFCQREPFPDRKQYPTLAGIPRCQCGALIRPHIVWFGELPFYLPVIMDELNRCTVLLVVGTSGLVYPAAHFVHWANSRYGDGNEPARTYYVGPEEPANAAAFTHVFQGKAGKILPGLITLG
jgi:NAD-dependent deacetylase